MAQGHVFTLKILFFEKRGDDFIPLVQMFVLIALMVLFLLYENINLSAKAEIIFAWTQNKTRAKQNTGNEDKGFKNFFEL